MEKILILSNTNFFSIFVPYYLKQEYQCYLLNLRYENENMTTMESILQQIEEIRSEFYYQKGVGRNPNLFDFHPTLLERIKKATENFQPQKILLEISKDLSRDELLLTRYIRQILEVPLLVFLRDVTNETELRALFQKKFGVSDILTENNFLSLQKTIEKKSCANEINE